MRHNQRLSSGALNWLTDPGADVTPAVRSLFMGELASSQGAVFMGSLNGLILKITGLCIDHRPVFVALFVIEIVCSAARLAIAGRVAREKARDEAMSLDYCVLSAIAWCALQGATAFAFMSTGQAAMQVLSATLIMAIIGPICARNYPAPRLALLLVCLCDLPFVAGACCSGDHWLLVLVPMTPPFVLGTMQIVSNFQKIAVAAVTGETMAKAMARQDHLTSLPNRLALSEALRDLSIGPGRNFVLLCIDLDGFKQINDTFGHHGGDCLLRQVARRLTANVKGTDAIFRIGGDEFVVIAYDMLPKDAVSLADRIIQTLTSESYLIDTHRARIGGSIGFACAPDDGTSGDDLHRKADAALYASKAAGKGVHRRSTLRLMAVTG